MRLDSFGDIFILRYKIALFPRILILPVRVQFLSPCLILESLLYYQHTAIIVVITIVLFGRGSLIFNSGCASYLQDHYDRKQKECPLRRSLNQDIFVFGKIHIHKANVNFGGMFFFIFLACPSSYFRCLLLKAGLDCCRKHPGR